MSSDPALDDSESIERRGTDRRPGPGAPAKRITSLDGLRGLAALIVLLHHSLLLTPSLIAPYRDPHATNVGSAAWWMSYTPIHVLWDGSMSVGIFFVLSGLVLTRAATGAGNSWAGYYPKRVVRLYVPVIVAVPLALVWHELSKPRHGAGLSDWLTGHLDHVSARQVVTDIVLVAPRRPGATTSVLWSLRWEVVFSLFLPVFVAFAVHARKLLLAKVAVCLALVAVGAAMGPVANTYQLGAVYQLPIFALGCLMAVEYDRLRAAAARITGPAWVGVVLLAIVLLTSYWLIYSTGSRSHYLHDAAVGTRVLQTVGAALIIFAALGGLRRFFEMRAVHLLGVGSFSLYLVHEPLVVAIGYWTEITNPAVLLITVPASLALTAVFWWAVEHRAELWSRAVDEQVRRRIETRG